MISDVADCFEGVGVVNCLDVSTLIFVAFNVLIDCLETVTKFFNISTCVEAFLHLNETVLIQTKTYLPGKRYFIRCSEDCIVALVYSSPDKSQNVMTKA